MSKSQKSLASKKSRQDFGSTKFSMMTKNKEQPADVLFKIVAGKMKKLSTRKASSTGQILHPAAYCLLKSMQEGSLERETSTRERAAQVLEHFDEQLFVFADEVGANHYD